MQKDTLSKLDRTNFPQPQFWGLLLALTALFSMGGSSRGDVQSLAVLNPLMITLCSIASLTLKPEHWHGKKLVFGYFALIFMLVAFYLLLLPAHMETLSRGTNDVAAIRAAADVHSATQALATTPNAAWQSLFSLFAPLAVFLFAVQLNRNDLVRTPAIIILVGAVSGIIGVLQLAGSPNGPLYLYQITNNGAAVGLFANRNHSAVFLACLFPILAIYVAKSHANGHRSIRIPQLITTAVAIILVPLILVTGSRSGMLAATAGLIGGVLLYNSYVLKPEGRVKNRSLAPIFVVSGLFVLVFATVYFSRAEAIDRIFAEPRGEIDRADFWTASLELFWRYFPFGVGPGSFVQAFQSAEPLSILNNTYLNRLHNDWLETVLTFGVPGILLLVTATAYFIRRSFLLWFRMDGVRINVAMGQMASVIISILLIASMTDYPLRTPAMMGLAALVFVWFIEADPKLDAAKKMVGLATRSRL